MSIIKVIIKPSFGGFEPSPLLEGLIEQRDQLGIFSLESRTDPVIVKFVEENPSLVSVNSWERLSVVEVDTSRQWTINDYDGAEGIGYIDYKLVRPSLNYVEKVREPFINQVSGFPGAGHHSNPEED